MKLSNSQLNKSKLAIENGTELILNISSDLVGDTNDENNFPHKLLLTNTLNTKFRGFVKLLQIIHKLIQNCQKLSCIK